MMEFFRAVFAPPRHLILLLAALWLGLALAETRAARHGIPKDMLNNVAFYGLFGYILGGRMLYALANYSAFARSPLSLLSPNPDLFDPFLALVVAVTVGLIYSSRQRLPLPSTLDALTPLFAVLAIGVSLSHLAAGTGFGRSTTVPWGIQLWNEVRHPSQVYELIAALLIFGWIWSRRRDAAPGIMFITFVALTAGARVFLEAFRGDSALIFGGFRLAQILAWMMLAAAFFTLEAIHKRAQAS